MQEISTVTIGAVRVPVAEVNSQRVVTLDIIDRVHGRPKGTAGRNFREHEARLIEGEDFHRICADEIRRRKILELSPKARGTIILLTETGYLLLVKALSDDTAWQVQRKLVAAYFRVQAAAQVAGPGKAELGRMFAAIAGDKIAPMATELAAMKATLDDLRAAMPGLQRAPDLALTRDYLPALGIAVQCGLKKRSRGATNRIGDAIEHFCRLHPDLPGVRWSADTRPVRLFHHDTAAAWLDAGGRELIRREKGRMAGQEVMRLPPGKMPTSVKADAA